MYLRGLKMTQNTDISDLIHALPEQPGVYQFYDKNGTILYIGKAKNLKKRVSSYFSRKKFESFKVKVLVNRVKDLKFIVVESESDALLLENNLIKKHQPRYNILLKDDKTFPWICVKNEPFPRVFSTRTVIQDGSQYYGPYTSAYAVKVLLNLIRQLYQLRTCKLSLTDENIKKGKFKVCLEYHIGNCQGPCVGLQSREAYDENINQIRNIIKGNLHEVISHLKTEMEYRASLFQFEEANRLKEKIEILSRYQSKSTIVNPSIHDVEVYSIINDEKEAYVNYLKVVKGAIIQAHTVEIKKKLEEGDLELLAFAVTDIRSRTDSKSREIIAPLDLSAYYPDLKITIPKRGDKLKLLNLSLRNAKSYRLEKLKRQEGRKTKGSAERILKSVQEDFRLDTLPVHIECFDNSNMQGSEPVAACVVFRDGKPAKKEYRHYNIKSVKGIDDFASMKEVVYRRYKRLIEEDRNLPQLIVIDGGKGQLSAALSSLDQLGLRGKIAIVGIAKRLEEIYFPGDAVPLYIDKNSESLKLIQNLRNEAHRFGITFHRLKRSGSLTISSLERIPGIGSSTIEKLFKRFKSIEGISSASLEELTKEVGLSRASKILEQMHVKEK
jgi:excinuclease ABC subunit C